MPAWWRGKSKSSSKSKSIPGSTSTQRKEEEEEGSSPEMQKGGEIMKEKANSFDGVLSAASGGGGKSGDLSPVSRRPSPLFALGHPLPRPSLSSPLSSPLPSPSNDHGSAAASSVSSSGSSDDAPDLGLYRYLAPINTPRGRNMLVGSPRQQHMTEDRYSPVLEHARCSDMPISPRKEFQLYNSDASSNGNAYSHASPETIFNPRMPNSGSNSRGHPFPTSPRNSRAFGISPGSPTGRQDDMRNPAHPLPLPPGSPNSSSSRSLQPQWKKGKLLGRGTFGHVYLGFNSGSGQMCAIKEVKVISDDSNSKESLKQLSQEITLLSQLSHPNIVQYLGSELDEVTLSVYLEYVSGGSIHKLLQEYGPFTEPVIRSYTAQILSGLAYLHGRNTVHRDIKGANILVDPTGEVKLADFGMAKHISAYNSIRSFKGSPYWMAPEVIMNTAGYNLSVDIWSLGCTILEMATSKPPWSQFEGVAAIFKIGNSKDIPEIPQHLSSEGKSFLKLCLQRDPNARPTAAELMDHPFVRDQTTIKAAKLSVTRDALPSPTDGCRTPISRSMSPLRESDYGTRHIFGIPSASKSPGDLIMINTRANMSLPVSPCSSPWANMSLPVSPCSSPLRNYRQSNRSCVPSPSHPAFSAGAVNYSSSNHKLYPVRPSSNNFRDPWPDVSQQRVPSLIDSPRR